MPSIHRSPSIRFVPVLILAGLMVVMAMPGVPQTDVAPKESSTMMDESSNRIAPDFQEMFEYSRTEKKGLILYFNGQSLPGIVTSVEGDAVILRNREFDKIVVKIDRIDAMARN